MRLGIARGRSLRARRLAAQAAAEVGAVRFPVEEPRECDRLLLLGDDRDLGVLAAALDRRELGGLAIAFGGTASCLSRTFASDIELGASLERLTAGTEHAIDLGLAYIGDTRHVFVAGIAAGAAARARAAMPWGQSAGMVAIDAPRALQVPRARALLVSGSQFWGDWQVAPRAALDDGLLEIQVFAGGVAELSRLRPAIRRGLHLRSRLVTRVAAEGAELRLPQGWPVRVDGVAVGPGPLMLGVAGGALTLLV